MTRFTIRERVLAALLGAAVITILAGPRLQSVVRAAQDDVTPGMLFGPLRVESGQHIELCSSYLSDGNVVQAVHFRNLSTGEVTAPKTISIQSGGGACVTYTGKGRVVGMARGDGPGSDWVSPSNALFGTMSVVDANGSPRVTVLGNAKMWLVGL